MANNNAFSDVKLGVLYGLFSAMEFVGYDLLTGDVFKSKKKKKDDKVEEQPVRELTEEEKKYGEDVDLVQELPAVVEVVAEDKEAEGPFTINKEDENILLNNVEVNQLLKKYNYDEKILASAILYICGKVTADQIGALISSIDPKAIDDNMNTLNSITLFYTGRAFATTIVDRKQFDFDTVKLEKVVREVVGLDILKNNDNITNIIDKTKKYVADKTGKSAIIFDNSKLNSVKSKVSDSAKRKVEGFIGELVKDYEHILFNDERCQGIIILQLITDKGTKDIPVDIGGLLGECKVIMRDINQMPFYTSNKELIKKFIEEDYILNDKDIANIKVSEHQFVNHALYAYYSVAQVQNKLSELSRENYNIFEGKLQFILGMISAKYGVTPLMRVKNFKDQNNFILVSDIKVKSPGLSTEFPILPGLTVKVSEEFFDIVIKDENGNVIDSDHKIFGQEFINAYTDLKVGYQAVEKAAQMDLDYQRVNNPSFDK